MVHNQCKTQKKIVKFDASILFPQLPQVRSSSLIRPVGSNLTFLSVKVIFARIKFKYFSISQKILCDLTLLYHSSLYKCCFLHASPRTTEYYRSSDKNCCISKVRLCPLLQFHPITNLPSRYVPKSPSAMYFFSI